MMFFHIFHVKMQTSYEKFTGKLFHQHKAYKTTIQNKPIVINKAYFRKQLCLSKNFFITEKPFSCTDVQDPTFEQALRDDLHH